MAKRITNEELRVDVVINGNKAQAELLKLEERQRELVQANKELRLEKAKLDKTDKDYAETVKRMDQQMKENNQQIKQGKERMGALRQEVGITSLTTKQLRQEAKSLRAQIADMIPGDPKRKELVQELEKINMRIKEVDVGSERLSGSWEKVSGSARGFFAAITAGTLAFGGLLLGIRKVIDLNARLDESMADVQKTTGLTKQEVRELKDELENINTRSSLEELLGLARIAGKLGVTGKADVLAFAKAADQINVALSEDLGGNVEDAIRKVGKLVDIFKLKEELGLEQALLKVGSAINTLGASSTASEEYLVDFTERMAGIAPAAKISAANILGIGATLDQLGQTAEVSSTVLGKLMVAMGTDYPRYAEIAGMSTQDFVRLLNEDANEALIRVLEGAQGTSEGLQGMAETLEALGVDGQRTVQVVGVLTENIELLRQQQDLANESFEKGTSITEEFNTKNNTLSASIEKMRKSWEIFLSSTFFQRFASGVVGSLGQAVEWFNRLTGAVKDQSVVLEEQRVRLNQLGLALADSQIPLETRIKLMNELKSINPDIVKGLEAENLNYDLLRVNIQRANQEMINRIVLQKKMEEVERSQGTRDKAMQELAEQRLFLQEKINRQVTAYSRVDKSLSEEANRIAYDTSLTFEERAKSIDELGRQYNETVKSQARGGERVTQVYTTLWQTVGVNLIRIKELEKAERELLDVEKERQELIKQLGIDTTTQNTTQTTTQNTTQTSTEFSTLSTTDTKDSKTITTKIETVGLTSALQDLEAWEKAMQQHYLRSLSAREQQEAREIMEIDQHYQQLIDAANKLGYDTSELQQQWDQDRDAAFEQHNNYRLDVQRGYQELSKRMLEEYGIEMLSADQLTFEQMLEQYEEMWRVRGEIQANNQQKQEADEQLYNSKKTQLIQENINAYKELYSAVASIAQAGLNQELEEVNRVYTQKEIRLKQQLENNVISQEEYNKQQEQLNQERSQKELEIKQKQAKIEKLLSITNIVVSGAEAISRITATAAILTANHVTAPLAVMAYAQIPVVVAAKVAQIAAINKQPLPQYLGGGFTGEGDTKEVAGEVHKNEYVVPERILRIPWVRRLIEEIELLRTGRRSVTDRIEVSDDPEILRRVSMIQSVEQDSQMYNDMLVLRDSMARENYRQQFRASLMQTVVKQVDAPRMPVLSPLREVSINTDTVRQIIREYNTQEKAFVDPELRKSLQQLNMLLEKGIYSKVIWADIDEAQRKMDEIKEMTGMVN
jgi:TP901 family phage tail tape measure protein